MIKNLLNNLRKQIEILIFYGEEINLNLLENLISFLDMFFKNEFLRELILNQQKHISEFYNLLLRSNSIITELLINLTSENRRFF